MVWDKNPSNPSQGKCIVGNDAARAFAESPQTHYKQKNSGNPLPPFYYDRDNSVMYITPEYCASQGLKYGTGSSDGRGGDGSDNCKGKWTRTNGCLQVPLGFDDCREVCVGEGPNGEIFCETDDDCPKSSKIKSDPNGYVSMKNTKCIKRPGYEKAICMGDSSDCVNTLGTGAAKFLLGETLTSFFEQTPQMRACEVKAVKDLTGNDTTQPTTENMTNQKDIKKIVEKFNQIPEEVSKLADNKYIVQKQLLYKDIAGSGINLYLVRWDADTARKVGLKTVDDITFDYDEVYKKYPQICTIVQDLKFVQVNKKQLINNDIKRIYVIMSSTSWLKSILEENNLKKS
jgi:hypothetical protein